MLTSDETDNTLAPILHHAHLRLDRVELIQPSWDYGFEMLVSCFIKN